MYSGCYTIMPLIFRVWEVPVPKTCHCLYFSMSVPLVADSVCGGQPSLWCGTKARHLSSSEVPQLSQLCISAALYHRTAPYGSCSHNGTTRPLAKTLTGIYNSTEPKIAHCLTDKLTYSSQMNRPETGSSLFFYLLYSFGLF